MPPKTYAVVMMIVNSCSAQQFISYDFGSYKLNANLIVIDSTEDVALFASIKNKNGNKGRCKLVEVTVCREQLVLWY